jgi:hypothetical protein
MECHRRVVGGSRVELDDHALPAPKTVGLDEPVAEPDGSVQLGARKSPAVEEIEKPLLEAACVQVLPIPPMPKMDRTVARPRRRG